jgi:hypothetical protein
MASTTTGSSRPASPETLEPLVFATDRSTCICGGPASTSGYYCSIGCASVSLAQEDPMMLYKSTAFTSSPPPSPSTYSFASEDTTNAMGAGLRASRRLSVKPNRSWSMEHGTGSMGKRGSVLLDKKASNLSASSSSSSYEQAGTRSPTDSHARQEGSLCSSASDEAASPTTVGVSGEKFDSSRAKKVKSVISMGRISGALQIRIVPKGGCTENV